MRFIDPLREENNDVFEATFNHPFAQGIGRGAKAAVIIQ